MSVSGQVEFIPPGVNDKVGVSEFRRKLVANYAKYQAE